MTELIPTGPTPSSSDFDAGSADRGVGRPRIVGAARGGSWWETGWNLFTKSPFVWIAITVLYVAILFAVGIIPVVGMFAPTLLAPVLAGGVIYGFRDIDQGKSLTVTHLFAGFNHRLAPLMIVGVLQLAATIVLVVIVGIILLAAIGVAGVGALVSTDPMEVGTALLDFGMTALLALLVGSLLGLPIAMAFWFAPALIVLRNADPVTAIKKSFEACLYNVWSMLIYGLLGFAFAIVATIPLGLGWLVLLPVFAGSVYASYKDIFSDA